MSLLERLAGRRGLGRQARGADGVQHEPTAASPAASGRAAGPGVGRPGILAALGRCLSPANALVVLASALRHSGTTEEALARHGLDQALLLQLKRGVDLFCRDPVRATAGQAELAALMAPPSEHGDAPPVIVRIEDENGVVDARSQARALCVQAGFSATEQVKVATAVSELARNIQRYVGRGTVTLTLLRGEPPGIEVVAEDQRARHPPHRGGPVGALRLEDGPRTRPQGLSAADGRIRSRDGSRPRDPGLHPQVPPSAIDAQPECARSPTTSGSRRFRPWRPTVKAGRAQGQRRAGDPKARGEGSGDRAVGGARVR